MLQNELGSRPESFYTSYFWRERLENRYSGESRPTSRIRYRRLRATLNPAKAERRSPTIQ